MGLTYLNGEESNYHKRIPDDMNQPRLSKMSPDSYRDEKV